jgi:hypothetical protein
VLSLFLYIILYGNINEQSILLSIADSMQAAGSSSFVLDGQPPFILSPAAAAAAAANSQLTGLMLLLLS